MGFRPGKTQEGDLARGADEQDVGNVVDEDVWWVSIECSAGIWTYLSWL